MMQVSSTISRSSIIVYGKAKVTVRAKSVTALATNANCRLRCVLCRLQITEGETRFMGLW